MKTDELIHLWQSPTEEDNRTSVNLREIIQLSVESAHSRLNRRIRIDLILAISCAILIVLAAYLAGLNYWPTVAGWMAGFLCVVLFLYRGHRYAVSMPFDSNHNQREMIQSAKKRIHQLAWGYRISIPLFTGILCAYFWFNYQLYSALHILWIIPFVILLTELVIWWMYRKTVLDYENWDKQLERIEDEGN